MAAAGLFLIACIFRAVCADGVIWGVRGAKSVWFSFGAYGYGHPGGVSSIGPCQERARQYNDVWGVDIALRDVAVLEAKFFFVIL